MKYNEGNIVEVLKRKEEQYDSWFPAKILAEHGSMYSVRYELFLTSKGELVEETINEQDVRPCPPPLNDRVQWIVGDIAEVLDVCSWRIGQVMKVLRNDRFVIKLFGTVQLQEHDASNLRVQQSWQNDQWIVSAKGRVGNQFSFNENDFSVSSVGNLDKKPSQGTGRKTSAGQRSKKKHWCSSIKNVQRNHDSGCGFSPAGGVGAIGAMDRKRKSNADRSPKITKRAIYKKVGYGSPLKDMVTESFLHKSFKFTVKDYATNHAMSSSSIPHTVADVNNECSVASCSVNEYPVYTYKNHRKCSNDTAFNSIGGAMFSSPFEDQKEYSSKSAAEMAGDIHKLELQAYRSTMQVLHTSGPLSWEKESLLTNLRLSLNISNEEHLLHLRHLLSA